VANLWQAVIVLVLAAGAARLVWALLEPVLPVLLVLVVLVGSLSLALPRRRN
jgi:hypothetical protein